ncbi:MAG TPA: hypothetical protein P5532_12040 [Planctomycetota bacterium]|nr:hypothetical protein [Planctomycetota bacterium]
MGILTEAEKAAIVADVREMILAAGQKGRRLVPPASGERLYGSDEQEYQDAGEFDCEFVPTPHETLRAMGADAVISVLPEQEIEVGDRVTFEGGGAAHLGVSTFKVITVVEERLFGLVTHKTVQLVKHHG